MKAAIARGLGKSYRIYPRPMDRIIEAFGGGRRHTEFRALRDVDFDVSEGETIGIVGRNGAGKSTLLKLLCGVTVPTTGSIEANGKIASILELGTGFHPEFSGRDNAALNAAILGLTPDEVRRRLPEMLAFSELESFLDRPVKTYSSGMYMRLAFSVAVHVDPDILVIDEALAVGDGHFQRKCVDAIHEMQARGKTIFFCSHALYTVSNLCQRALWLDDGVVRAHGPAADVVRRYESFLEEQPADATAAEGDVASPVRIHQVEILDGDANPESLFKTGDAARIRVHVRAVDPSLAIHLMIGVARGADEIPVFAAGTRRDGMDALQGESAYAVDLIIDSLPLLEGDYHVVTYVGDENALHVWDRRDLRGAFEIRGGVARRAAVAIDHRWIAPGVS